MAIAFIKESEMLQLSLAVNDYDRTSAIFDGRVRVEGCETHAIVLEAEEAFHRAFKFKEFDVTEMSLSSHAFVTASGTSDYVGIPAFVFRMFRHSGMYVRTDRGITRPEDLRGKTIGLAEYQQTANVWARGILQHEYGVAATDVTWRTGGFQEPGRGERTPIKLPPEIDCEPIPTDRTLSDMLDKGELDAVITPRPPASFMRGSAPVARLFPDYVPVELAYFQKTRIFPIMHLIGVRRTLVEKHPWLPVSILKAFLAAKALVQVRFATMLNPWAPAEYDRLKSLLGDDFWSYNVEPNRHVLETFVRYSHEQGILPRQISIDEMFASSTLELSKI
jgi:4,5-dihydroxyphthalate decarboxylase